MNVSVCGIDCDACKFFADKRCDGCRKAAPEGKCIWEGRCDLYDCCAERELAHCGKCADFPCSRLKRWAADENPERIHNLRVLNENENG